MIWICAEVQRGAGKSEEEAILENTPKKEIQKESEA